MGAHGLEELTASWGGEGGAWAVLVHGGAGDVKTEMVVRHVDGCRAAAEAAAAMLRGGGDAIDAAQRAVEVLEDDPCFNAGTGACLDADGAISLDAALMEGAGLRAGGVCAMPPFRHPIAIARAALEDGAHVLYAGEGAARFAIARGFAPASLGDLMTETARVRWEAVRAAAEAAADGAAPSGGGTVGAVVRDARGNVVAATSTGGRVNKHPGRVGDSPILGAGTYADDEGGACSATGHGEAMMRVCLAKTASDWMRDGAHPEDAARAVIRMLARRARGTGGVILVDRDGRLGLARNTRTMTWAAAGAAMPEVVGGA
jgi:beta-aspartyl-peptidase (threonine type)